MHKSCNSLILKFKLTGQGFNRYFGSIEKKPKVVVVGAGWAGYRMASDLDKKKYDVYVVSPRNHFLFTPLLPSTAVGTVEFRAIQEPVRSIRNIKYYQASVNSIDFDDAIIHCTDAFTDDKHKFNLDYDALILAPGSETNSFGVHGVETNEHVFFLKQLEHSRAIRNRLINCFERASSPGATADDMKRLLTFVIVGGGPTSVEFTAELHDFIKHDVSVLYPDLYPLCDIHIIEASRHILGTMRVPIYTLHTLIYAVYNTSCYYTLYTSCCYIYTNDLIFTVRMYILVHVYVILYTQNIQLSNHTYIYTY